MQFKKLRRNDRKRNNRKEDSGFVIEPLAAPKYVLFTGDIFAQCMLCRARASLAAWISRSCPLLGRCLCHPRNQSCSQLLLSPSLVNALESLKHICLTEILSEWSLDSNNTSQIHDKLMLPVDIQRYSSRLKCFKAPWQHFIVPQAYSPPACFTQDPRKSSL